MEAHITQRLLSGLAMLSLAAGGLVAIQTVAGAAAARAYAGSHAAGAASAGVQFYGAGKLPNTYEEGLAVLGTRYIYVGTSSGNTMYVYNVRTGHIDARWQLPGVSGGAEYGYGMEHLTLSPDNRTLYFSNLVRGDVVALDVTGRQPLRQIFLKNRVPLGLEVSADNRYLYVQGGRGTDVYDTATGNNVGSAPLADAATPAPNGTLYGLSIGVGHAAVYAYNALGGGGRLLASLSGRQLAAQIGSLAVSPDGRRLYVLWDGLRALDTRSGRSLGFTPMPLTPSYTGMALAPNGQQAMLWAPRFTALFDSTTSDPNYVIRHYGFVAGGVVPVDLRTMQPIRAPLARITTPKAVGYTSDSRWAYITQQHEIDMLATGTVGRDTAPIPHVSLALPRAGGPSATSTNSGSGTNSGGGGTSGGGGSTQTATPTPTQTSTCTAWDVSGTWTLSGYSAAGSGSGQVTLQQSGTTLSGSVTLGAVTWTITGTIQGSTVNLTLSAPGQIQLTFSGTVSPDGTAINGDNGSLIGGHAHCA